MFDELDEPDFEAHISAAKEVQCDESEKNYEFHHVSAKGFQRFALPRDKAPLPENSWCGGVCHCIECEFHRYKIHIEASSAIVFLDMDNIAIFPDDMCPSYYFNLGIFLWGFGNDVHMKMRLPCVPCGPADQAVDIVILLSIMKMNKAYPAKKLFVVTMDGDLQKASRKQGAHTFSMRDHSFASWSLIRKKLDELGDLIMSTNAASTNA